MAPPDIEKRDPKAPVLKATSRVQKSGVSRLAIWRNKKLRLARLAAM